MPPTPQGIAFKVRASLGLDTSESQQAVTELAQKTQAALQDALNQVKPGQVPPTGHIEPPLSWQQQVERAHGPSPLQRTDTEQLRDRERIEQAKPALSEWQRQIEEAHGPQPRGFKTATEQMQDSERREQAKAAERRPMSASDIAKMRLREEFGSGFSYKDRQKEIQAMIAEERQRVRDLESQYRDLGRAADEVSKKKREAIRTDLDEARSHRDALQSVMERGLIDERRLGQMADEAASGGLLQGMTVREAMGGGLIGRMMNKTGGWIMRHPAMAGGLAVAGAGLWAMNRMSDESGEALQYNIADLNVGRRIGAGRSIRDRTGPLGTLGYTPQQALGIADAYGMAGTATAMSRTYRAIGAVARDAGFGENPEVVGSLARRATQMGIEPGQQQEQFWAMMQRSMSEGVRSGVDKAERMRALFAMMEATAANTGVLSKEMVAGLTATTGVLSEGGRLLSGEKGAQTFMSMMESFQQPASIAQEFLQINAIKAAFKGRMPTAKELGKTGIAAQRYEQMGEIEQQRLLTAELPTNPALLTKFLGEMGKVAPSSGPQRMLFETTVLSRMTPKVREEMAVELGRIIDKRKGAGTAERMGGDLFGLMQGALESGKGSKVEVDKLLKEKMPELGGISEEERIRKDKAEAELKVSQTMLDATQDFQEASSKFKTAVAEAFDPAARALNKMVGFFGLGKTDQDAQRDEFSRRMKEFQGRDTGWYDRLSSGDKAHFPTPTRPLSPDMQAFIQAGAATEPVQVVVTGEIALTGENLPAGAKLDPAVINLLVARQIREMAERKSAMQPNRASLSRPPSP